MSDRDTLTLPELAMFRIASGDMDLASATLDDIASFLQINTDRIPLSRGDTIQRLAEYVAAMNDLQSTTQSLVTSRAKGLGADRDNANVICNDILVKSFKCTDQDGQEFHIPQAEPVETLELTSYDLPFKKRYYAIPDRPLASVSRCGCLYQNVTDNDGMYHAG